MLIKHHQILALVIAAHCCLIGVVLSDDNTVPGNVKETGGASVAQPLGIPLKPDPPPSIDGRLDEWAMVPNLRTLDKKENVVYGGQGWKAADDLSANVQLAWRDENLYLAADITDDHVVQSWQGRDMYRGDHVELYLDVAPDFESNRAVFGVGQVHLGLSPGNFQKTGDALFDRAPEAVVFSPQGETATGVIVASQKTERGYTLEAAIPWSAIKQWTKYNGLSPASGVPLGIEVGISESDSLEAGQQRMMTLLTTEWEPQKRNRLMPAVLAPANGVAPAVVRGLPLFDAAELKLGEKKEFTFEAPAIPSGKQAIITLKARASFKEPAGYNPMMRITLNGQTLDASHLSNKKMVEARVDGSEQPMIGAGRFSVPYTPTFEAVDSNPHYALKRVKTASFDLRVDKLLQAGKNTLVFENAADAGTDSALVIGDGRLEFRAPVAEPVKRAAPTGALPVMQPDSQRKTPYTLQTAAGGEPAIEIGGTRFQVESRFSTPDGNWQKGSNKFFSLERKVEQRDEVIVIKDTFTNLTGENLPLMQRYQVTAPNSLKKVWLAGMSPASLAGTAANPANPTTYAVNEKNGIGVMALDDVLQVHVFNFSGDNFVGLADNQLVVKPKATHTTEWVIVPTTKPDYWTFVNAARRFRDVNFPIQGAFTFVFPGPSRNSGKWDEKQIADFFTYKGTKYLAASYSGQYHGTHPHGSSFLRVDWEPYKKELARFRRVLPKQIEFMSYFHCFLDQSEDADKRYPEARVLRSDGTQSDYGVPNLRHFVPTETNAFGRDVTKIVDTVLAPQPQGFGCDGVYWDELEYSSAHYHYDDFDNPKSGLPWDGVSADIDPQTKKINRLKSSVTLISQPYRLAMARRILAHGPLYGNGAPHTRSMMQLHFPRFVETGSISNCTQTHLYTPIALGDHLTERNELDAYRWMVKALDYSCLYAWYDDSIFPTHPTLTSYMFPTTPLELHEGYIIGKERIVTNRSGLFGWGDNSQHEVHVFNDEGREVKDFKAPMVKKDGKTYTELRLAEDWSAAIVRK